MKKWIIPLNCLWTFNNSQSREKNDYLMLYDINAVDRNDRGSSDNTTTMWTNHWYLCFFFWILDHAVHVVFIVACFCVKFDVGPPEWKSHLNKNGNTGKKMLVVSGFTSSASHRLNLNQRDVHRCRMMNIRSMNGTERGFFYAQHINAPVAYSTRSWQLIRNEWHCIQRHGTTRIYSGRRSLFTGP